VIPHRFIFVLIAGAALLLAGCSRQEKITTRSPEALRLYQQGVGLWEKFYYREAKESFLQAIAADSSFALAWGRLALVYMRVGDEKAADAAGKRAIELSQATTPREGMVVRLWLHWARSEGKAGLATSDTLVREYPDDKEVYLFRGFLFETAGDVKSAISAYRTAIEKDSTYAIAVMSLGYAYSYIGDQDQAIASMQRYIRLAPEAADPRASYGDLLLWVGRYDDALDQYRKSLEIKPDYWYAFQRIGEIYSTLGRLRDAREQILKAVAFLPRDRRSEADLMITDGRLEIARGHYEKALELLKSAGEADTSYQGWRYGAALAQIKLRRFDEAEKNLEQIHESLLRRNLDNSPGSVEYDLLHARLLAEQGSYADALASGEKALDHATRYNRGIIFSRIAEIYLKQGQYESALDACGEALSVNPNLPAGLLVLTKVYHTKGDKGMTVEIGGRLFALWKDADPDFQDLIELRRLLGRTPSV
jgi:tetratricopeptide (TPR) repeat protein